MHVYGAVAALRALARQPKQGRRDANPHTRPCAVDNWESQSVTEIYDDMGYSASPGSCFNFVNAWLS